MSTYPPYGPGPGSVGQRIEEAIELIEMELRHAAAYVNDAVIPQVRSESISALRTVADSLRKFADRLDQPVQPVQQPPQPPRPPGA
jgi:predicted transcriptional regulator